MALAVKYVLCTVALLLSSCCTEAQLAAMSVDLGDEFLKFGLVKPGVPMETVINKESRRKTPNIVAFRKGERHFGDVAAQMSVKFPQNSISSYIDLIGKPFDHPIVDEYKVQFPHLKLSAHPDRNTVVFDIDDTSIPVETLLAMTLWNAQEQTAAHAGQTVKNVVVAVPSYFNHTERVAVANATQIAGLNLLGLISDGSAAGLNYGVFRRKELTEKPQNLLIYDVGARKIVATLVEYQLVPEKEGSKEKVPVAKTIGVGYDRQLGGRDVTAHVRTHLAAEFKAKHKTEKELTENPRAMAKLWKEADRVKQVGGLRVDCMRLKVLSANADHVAQVESLFEDKDFKVKVSRDLIDQYIDSLGGRFLQPVKDALQQAGLDMEAVDQVVLMGAGTRIPRLQKDLSDFINGKELARFLNTDEAIALGAVYEAAARSKGFRVKAFRVEEKPVFPTTEEEQSFTGLSEAEITEAKKVLSTFEKNEKLKVEKETALNSLESLVYDVAAKLDDDAFNKYVTAEEQTALREKSDQIRTWLEDEVTPDTDAKTLKDKRSELVAQSKKIAYRKKQHEERPKNYAKIEETLEKAKGLRGVFTNSSSANESIFTEEELKKYEDELNKVGTWFSEQKEAQSKLELNQDPVITVREITEKIKLVNNEVNLMKSKVYVYQVKVAKEKREAEEKARKEKEAAEKAAAEAAKNETVAEGEVPKAEENGTATEPTADSSDSSTAAPQAETTPTPESDSATPAEDEKTEL